MLDKPSPQLQEALSGDLKTFQGDFPAKTNTSIQKNTNTHTDRQTHKQGHKHTDTDAQMNCKPFNEMLMIVVVGFISVY